MKNIIFQLFTVALLSTAATPVRAQEGKVMQIHSGGSVVYEVPTAQVDSVTFASSEFPKTITPVLLASGNWEDLANIPTHHNKRIVRTTDEWNELITDMGFNVGTEEIDFSTHQVIATFDYVRGNGGWSIDVTGIKEYDDSIVVVIQNLSKGNFSSVITQAWSIVKIPVSDKKIVFESNLELGVGASRDNWADCIKRQDLTAGTVYLINSDEELPTYLSCLENAPTINFDNLSLLIVFGNTANNVIAAGPTRCYQSAPGKCELDVSVRLGTEAVSDTWVVFLLTYKIPDNTKITLELTERQD